VQVDGALGTRRGLNHLLIYLLVQFIAIIFDI